MERLTKAAIATGGAAVLLLGGAGTMAYWTAQGTAGADELTSGNLQVTAADCGDWAFTDDPEGGGTPALLVPGDTVSTTCTVTVTGAGDHLRVTAALADGVVAGGDLGALLTVTTGAVEIDGAAVPAGGFDLSGGGPVDITVVVDVEFPYGDALTPEESAAQFNLDATFTDAIVIDVTQVHA